MNQSPRFSSTQFRPALQFFAPGEILAPEQTLSFLRRKVARLVPPAPIPSSELAIVKELCGSLTHYLVQTALD